MKSTTVLALLGASARACLSIVYSTAPLKTGLLIENSLVEMKIASWLAPIVGWSPKHGQPGLELSVLSSAYRLKAPSGLGVVLTARSNLDVLVLRSSTRLLRNQRCVLASQ